MQKITIAIDGYSSCGKSTLAKALAQRLHYSYVDTGAMYRAVALVATRRGIPLDDESQLAAVATTIEIHFEHGKVFVDREEVTAEIRTEANTAATRPVANAPLVRGAMKQMQRQMAAGRDVVTTVAAQLIPVLTARAR